jgi:hypothetical protein
MEFLSRFGVLRALVNLVIFIALVNIAFAGGTLTIVSVGLLVLLATSIALRIVAVLEELALEQAALDYAAAVKRQEAASKFPAPEFYYAEPSAPRTSVPSVPLNGPAVLSPENETRTSGPWIDAADAAAVAAAAGAVGGYTYAVLNELGKEDEEERREEQRGPDNVLPPITSEELEEKSSVDLSTIRFEELFTGTHLDPNTGLQIDPPIPENWIEPQAEEPASGEALEPITSQELEAPSAPAPTPVAPPVSYTFAYSAYNPEPSAPESSSTDSSDSGSSDSGSSDSGSSGD